MSLVRISAETPVSLIGGFRDCPHSLQANTGMLPRLGHGPFVPNNFEFIVRQSSRHWTLYSADTESVAKQTTRACALRRIRVPVCETSSWNWQRCGYASEVYPVRVHAEAPATLITALLSVLIGVLQCVRTYGKVRRLLTAVPHQCWWSALGGGDWNGRA
jgi:hypothetical protein